jgi:GNAT superfamily N-acetyltransferase
MPDPAETVGMTREAVAIRRAETADAPAVTEVYIASRRASAQFIPTVHSDDETRAWIGGYLLPTLEVWVAVDGATSAIVGMMALDGNAIVQLYIAPAWQRRGIGGDFIALAKHERPAHLTLYTFQKNAPARRFHEARGFSAIEFTDGACNEEREPDVLYEWVPRPQM